MISLFRKGAEKEIKTEKNKKYLNLGCGRNIRPGWVNCDIQDNPNIDKSFNLETFPYPFKNDEFDYIYLNNILEHLLLPLSVINELYRIAKNDAIIHIIVPYFNCASAYNDITHHHYFNRRTFELMFHPNSGYKLEKDNRFKIISLKLEPTLAGKVLPSFLREIISLFIGGVIGSIECKVRVLKLVKDANK